MSMFDTESWKPKYRDAAQEKVPNEHVEAAWLFYRTGGYAGLALGPLSPLAAVVARTVGKKRGRAAEPVPAGADPDRSGLGVSVRDAAVNTEVTLESPGEEEKIICSTGKDATSREFLELLAQPAPPAPAPA
jgi:hypothetical protein